MSPRPGGGGPKGSGERSWIPPPQGGGRGAGVDWSAEGFERNRAARGGHRPEPVRAGGEGGDPSSCGTANERLLITTFLQKIWRGKRGGAGGVGGADVEQHRRRGGTRAG